MDLTVFEVGIFTTVFDWFACQMLNRPGLPHESANGGGGTVAPGAARQVQTHAR